MYLVRTGNLVMIMRHPVIRNDFSKTKTLFSKKKEILFRIINPYTKYM